MSDLTREEAKSWIIDHWGNDLEDGTKQSEVVKICLSALSEELSEDGTLTVHVSDGSKVTRVFVMGDNIFGGLYYPDSAENKGEWIDKGNGSYVCSNCKTEWTTSQIEKMCFCPTCGTGMREPKGEKIRCNTCKNNDDELSGECYECVKGIFDHYEPQEREE